MPGEALWTGPTAGNQAITPTLVGAPGLQVSMDGRVGLLTWRQVVGRPTDRPTADYPSPKLQLTEPGNPSPVPGAMTVC